MAAWQIAALPDNSVHNAIMSTEKMFLISQSGRALAVVHARNEESAIARAKGLGEILGYSPSIPLQAAPVNEKPAGLPSFSSEYFEMLGFKK